jgi:hypothetical protein
MLKNGRAGFAAAEHKAIESDGMRGISSDGLQAWTFQDKSTWGDGPWLQEPDKAQWVDLSSDLPCLAVRQWTFGNWCGYVGIRPGHPYYRKRWQTFRDTPSEHLAIKFSNFCARHDPLPPPDKFTAELRSRLGLPWYIPAPERQSLRDIAVFHTADEHERIWWIGFDLGYPWGSIPAEDALLDKIRAGEWRKEWKIFRNEVEKANLLPDMVHSAIKNKACEEPLFPNLEPRLSELLRPLYRDFSFVQTRCHELALAFRTVATAKPC